MSTIEKDVLNLQSLEATLLSTVAARAIASKEGTYIHDPVSEDLYARLSPYITEKYDKRGITSVALRCKVFDAWIRDFIKEAPDAVCVYAGAGLDPRFQRVDNGRIEWYNMDLEDVMTIRKRLLPASEREHNLIGNVFESAWLEQVQENGRPVFIIMEGMLQYFTSAEVTRVLGIIADRFPGAQIIMDILSMDFLKNKKAVKRMAPEGTTFRWAVDHPSDVSKMDQRYVLGRYLRISELFAQQSFFIRLAMKIPKMKRMCGFNAIFKIKD